MWLTLKLNKSVEMNQISFAFEAWPGYISLTSACYKVHYDPAVRQIHIKISPNPFSHCKNTYIFGTKKLFFLHKIKQYQGDHTGGRRIALSLSSPSSSSLSALSALSSLYLLFFIYKGFLPSRGGAGLNCPCPCPPPPPPPPRCHRCRHRISCSSL